MVVSSIFEAINNSAYSSFLLPVIIIILTFVFARLARAIIQKTYERVSVFHGRKLSIDQTHYILVRRLTAVLIYFMGIILVIYTIPSLKEFSTTLIATAGVVAVVIGFAMKDIFSNLLSGILIAIFEPIRIGDMISYKDEFGTVEDITLRHTVVKTWDNKRLIVPNLIITNETLVNYSLNDEKILKYVDMDISYDSDVDLAKEIMKEEAISHPNFLLTQKDHPLVSAKDEVKVRVTGLKDSAVTLRLYVWAQDQVSAFRMGCDLLESIKKRFDSEGVEIPYPYRTLVYKKDMDRNKIMKVKNISKTSKKKIRMTTNGSVKKSLKNKKTKK